MSINPIGHTHSIPPSSSSLTPQQKQELLHLYATLMGIAGAMADGGGLIAPSAATPLNQLQSLIAQLQQQLPNPAAQELLSQASNLLFNNPNNNAASNYQEGAYQLAANQTSLAAQDVKQAMTISGLTPTPSLFKNPGDVIDLIYGMSYTFSVQAGQYPPVAGVQQAIEAQLLPLLNNPAIAGMKNSQLKQAEALIYDATKCSQGEIAVNLQGAMVSFEQSGLLFT